MPDKKKIFSFLFVIAIISLVSLQLMNLYAKSGGDRSSFFDAVLHAIFYRYGGSPDPFGWFIVFFLPMFLLCLIPVFIDMMITKIRTKVGTSLKKSKTTEIASPSEIPMRNFQNISKALKSLLKDKDPDVFVTITIDNLKNYWLQVMYWDEHSGILHCEVPSNYILEKEDHLTDAQIKQLSWLGWKILENPQELENQNFYLDKDVASLAGAQLDQFLRTLIKTLEVYQSPLLEVHVERESDKQSDQENEKE